MLLFFLFLFPVGNLSCLLSQNCKYHFTTLRSLLFSCPDHFQKSSCLSVGLSVSLLVHLYKKVYLFAFLPTYLPTPEKVVTVMPLATVVTVETVVTVVTVVTKKRFFHQLGPSGPSCSVSHHVHTYVINLIFLGLSLALRSHDQIPVSHWSIRTLYP